MRCSEARRRRRRLRPHARPARPAGDGRAAARQRRQRRPAVRGRDGRVLGVARRRDVELRRTDYDVETRRSRSCAGRRASRRSRRSSPEPLRGLVSAESATRALRAPAWRVATSARLAAAASAVVASESGRSSSASREEHADATIALRFRSDVELLISVMLSAQTTDVNVNRVTERLFVKYRRPEDYLAVPVEELEQDIFADGLLPAEDEVDPRRDARAARGVRRRGAATSRGSPATARRRAQDGQRRRRRARGAQGIVVDTHVRRLSQRLGLTREEDPVKIERDLVSDRARGRLAPVPAPAHLARPTDLRRAQAAVRGVRPRRPLPVGPGRGLVRPRDGPSAEPRACGRSRPVRAARSGVGRRRRGQSPSRRPALPRRPR